MNMTTITLDYTTYGDIVTGRIDLVRIGFAEIEIFYSFVTGQEWVIKSSGLFI